MESNISNIDKKRLLNLFSLLTFFQNRDEYTQHISKIFYLIAIVEESYKEKYKEFLFGYEIIYNDDYGCKIENLMNDLFILEDKKILKITDNERVKLFTTLTENEIPINIRALMFEIYRKIKYMSISDMGEYVTRYSKTV